MSVVKVKKHLILEEKIQAIDMSEQGASHIAIAKYFDVSKTQISNLMKRKEEVRAIWNDGCVHQKKILKPSLRHPEVEEVVVKWLLQARKNGIHVKREFLQAKVIAVASEYGVPFSPSNGWIHSFKKRHHLYTGENLDESLFNDSTDMKVEREKDGDSSKDDETFNCSQHNITKNEQMLSGLRNTEGAKSTEKLPTGDLRKGLLKKRKRSSEPGSGLDKQHKSSEPGNGLDKQHKSSEPGNGLDKQHKSSEPGSGLDKQHKSTKIMARDLQHFAMGGAQAEGDERPAAFDVEDSYELENVFVCLGAGLFFKARPRPVYLQKKKQCADGRQADQRISMVLMCSGVGEKFSPLIVGRCQTLSLSPGLLPVKFMPEYAAHSKSWLTQSIFKNYLSRLNEKLSHEERHIVLLLHPGVPALGTSYSHIKTLPINSSSAGIFYTDIVHPLKVCYRKKFLRHLLSLKYQSVSTSDLAKQVTVLDAIVWLRSAWEGVSPSFISKAFLRCGLNGVQLEVTEGTEAPAQASAEEDGKALLPDGVSFNDFAKIDDHLTTFDPSEGEGREGESVVEAEEDVPQETEESQPSHVSWDRAMKCLEKVQLCAFQNSNPTLLHHVREAEYCLMSQRRETEGDV
ncbi:uncharacterized protein LOC101860960 [Aplysia californica]|uniref:Uncharacterized protein LOC101860960 n=1 Tax=Aplysia californica TaxID=6500 RepID=A0ABM0JGW9_APLCA|nr:uncharacterized protein LOC101860960 [Aplysia californica]XP_005093415.1 uncharacterized protein LOC101860960 [Aplysia californica]XP_005093416.1 uncharacterized protein LOC101860960 [Aplysia californica]